MEKALGLGAYGALARLFPDRDQGGKASRYASRSTAAALSGPTADFVDTLVRVVRGMTDGDIKDSDINAIRRLAPGGTLPVIRSVVDWGVVPWAKRRWRSEDLLPSCDKLERCVRPLAPALQFQA